MATIPTPDLLAFMRGLARRDADPQALRALLEGAVVPGVRSLWDDFGTAIPNRQNMLAVLRNASETGDGVEAQPVLADAMGDRDLALSALHSHLDATRGKSD